MIYTGHSGDDVSVSYIILLQLGPPTPCTLNPKPLSPKPQTFQPVTLVSRHVQGRDGKDAHVRDHQDLGSQCSWGW